ncbi:RNA chaperone Hfq [SCandidatus Aminicenantes bacterium Aminicenantia_JdfR_composite]|jgi:sRNA-binding regulator protein Hfq|nr:RNA chaperone Hfq [SCandidatus Aminicenantes bacterium Aminicenantia_JdfR_composite]MCP2597676.1 RNA chaperone Hfq [Candidatus Aminicenantes bacterium AC-335-G13]MCP2621148.1 RNA chaperone Hfq [Candidatus Aminicenantes bacterium AC-334-E05]
MTRKLIRPNLSEIKEKMTKPSNKKKTPPPYETYAENYYYLKQMNKKTPMVIVFKDGEVLEGIIEWYDKDCIKITRENAPNLLIYKSSIKYIYKLNEKKGNNQKDKENNESKENQE